MPGGGPVNTVHIEGNLAYIGSGRRMVNLDVSDPTNIVDVGRCRLCGHRCIRGSMYTLDWQIAVSNGVTCNLVLRSISNSTRAFSAVFYAQFHIVACHPTKSAVDCDERIRVNQKTADESSRQQFDSRHARSRGLRPT